MAKLYLLEREGTPVVCHGQLAQHQRIAASLVRSLFCGLPRQERRMAVFVSGSDESAGKTQRDTFLYAGWVGPEEDWSRFFAPAWQERVLDGPPAIPYLHMTEIRSAQWRAEYGISKLQADDRIDEALAVIDTMPTLYPVGLHVNAGHVRDKFAMSRVVASTGAKHPFDPDYICFLGYAFFVLQYVASHYLEAEMVDFIIERKRHVTKYIQEFHSQLALCLMALGEPSLSNLVGDLIPAGKERVPLQAADVLCWHSCRPVEAMDQADIRRYAKLARRKGTQMELSDTDIDKMDAALTT